MNDLFSSLYEWFGLIPFYSKDLGDHLRGFDITCTDYTGTPLYLWIGIVMIASCVIFYVAQYHLLNNTKFNKKEHWWMTAAALCLLNFLVSFGLAFSDFLAGNYCSQLLLSTTDCILFGTSVTIWTWIMFAVLTSLPIPRRYAGYNMTETTFWKP